MAVTPNSIVTPQGVDTASVAVNALTNTNLITPVNFTQLIAAGPNGGRCIKVEFLANATQAASQAQLYRSGDAGATKQLVKAKAFAAYALTTTSDIPSLDFGYSDAAPLQLEPNEILYVASAVAVTGMIARAEVLNL